MIIVLAMIWGFFQKLFEIIGMLCVLGCLVFWAIWMLNDGDL